MLKRQRLSKTLRIDDFRTDDELFSSSEEGSSESGFRTSFVSATDGLTVLPDDCELVVLLGVLAEEIITFGICVPSDVAKISFDSFRLVTPSLFRFDSISLFNSSSTFATNSFPDVELIALLTLMLAVVDVVFVVVLGVVLAKVLVIEIFECTLVLMDDVGERVVELLEVVIVVVLVLLILSVLLVVFVLLEI